MTLFHLRVIAFMLLGLALVVGLTRCGDKPELVIEATNAAAQTCRIHTLPSPCDGKCARQGNRSLT